MSIDSLQKLPKSTLGSQVWYTWKWIIIIWHVDHWCPTSLLRVICTQWNFGSGVCMKSQLCELRYLKLSSIYQQNPHLALCSYHEEHGTRNQKLLALMAAFTYVIKPSPSLLRSLLVPVCFLLPKQCPCNWNHFIREFLVLMIFLYYESKT